jgi:hypothetical protein
MSPQATHSAQNHTMHAVPAVSHKPAASTHDPGDSIAVLVRFTTTQVSLNTKAAVSFDLSMDTEVCLTSAPA